MAAPGLPFWRAFRSIISGVRLTHAGMSTEVG